MIQAAILILSGLGGALSVCGVNAQLGTLIALAGQPFWVWETWRKRQWGMLALSLWWAGVWGAGALRAWGLL